MQLFKLELKRLAFLPFRTKDIIFNRSKSIPTLNIKLKNMFFNKEMYEKF